MIYQFNKVLSYLFIQILQKPKPRWAWHKGHDSPHGGLPLWTKQKRGTNFKKRSAVSISSNIYFRGLMNRKFRVLIISVKIYNFIFIAIICHAIHLVDCTFFLNNDIGIWLCQFQQPQLIIKTPNMVFLESIVRTWDHEGSSLATHQSTLLFTRILWWNFFI